MVAVLFPVGAKVFLFTESKQTLSSEYPSIQWALTVTFVGLERSQ
jgi:hypothetical protein